jgi:hypothetical protein
MTTERERRENEIMGVVIIGGTAQVKGVLGPGTGAARSSQEHLLPSPQQKV